MYLKGLFYYCSSKNATVFNDWPEHFQGGGPFDFLAGLGAPGRIINGYFFDRESPK